MQEHTRTTDGKGTISVPASVFELAAQSMGAFFEPISHVERRAAARDFLDLTKSHKRAAILQRYEAIEARRVLEIGSGFGTNLAVWIALYGADAVGVEAGSEGFDEGYRASRILLAANGIDPGRVINASGEALPFSDGSFDIVYSANVLEHTSDPQLVLSEALRVLRPGGLLHMELPNFLSYFEGHYLVPMPPVLRRPVLSWWVRLLGRDPAFSRTLRTEINPVWCRQALRALRDTYPHDLVSLGADLFLERLAHPFAFETQMVETRLGRSVGLLHRANRRNWIGRLIVGVGGWYPIYLTVRRT